MKVLVVGGHGNVARRLLRMLADHGHEARATIRKPEQAGDIEEAGATPVVFDLERDQGLAEHVAGMDAVVFSAGAGPGSGPERKKSVDVGGAVMLIEACHEAGVSRYVIVSSINVDRPESWSEAMTPYFEAKRAADEALIAAGLDHTIVRPGYLTDDPGSGVVTVGSPLPESGKIPRDDVAATLLAVLETPATVGLTFEVISGETPVEEALAALTAAN